MEKAYENLTKYKVDIDLRDARAYYLNPRVGSIRQRQKCFFILLLHYKIIFHDWTDPGKGGRGD